VFFSKRKLIAFLFLFCVVSLLFFLSSLNAPYIGRSALLDITKLPLLAVHFFSSEIRAALFFHKSYWDNLKLKAENEELKNELLRLQELTAENSRLKDELDLKSRQAYKAVASKVIGKDFNSLRSYIILDKGRTSGIKRYAPVLTPAGLVGKILEVGFYSSKVILINDPDLSVPAMNLRTREQGLVSGTLDGRCKLRFLDLDSDIKEGDLIVTSGLNMTYPQGILIGKVRLVGTESSGLAKFAILEPSVKISSLEDVLIVQEP